MTESEARFEQFCAAQAIRFVRIETGSLRTPDYDIYVGGETIVVEVKEFEANDDDKMAAQEFEARGTAIWGTGGAGGRIRSKIDAAKRQIEARARGLFPSLLVLYDTRPEPIRGVSSYEILVAMYGWETIPLGLPDNPDGAVTFAKHRFGKGAKLRKDVHTYISGIAVLSENDGNALRLGIYVNDNADKPLPFGDLLQVRNVSLFARPPGAGNEFRNWARIVADE